MERIHDITGAPRIVLPIRVRGISLESRFFDEKAETRRVTKEFIVVRMHSRVDLDAEVHVTNLKNAAEATFRVVWLNSHAENGVYPAGLELLDLEGVLWDQDSYQGGQQANGAPLFVELECTRCHQKLLTPVPEAENECLGGGFMVARHCDTCKATAHWTLAGEQPAPVEPPPQAVVPDHKPAAPPENKRAKGRAPIKMWIQVIRNKYDTRITDLCETVNVSRTGVYFLSEKPYEVGEAVEVVAPYHPNSQAIPVPGRVVRRVNRKDSFVKGIAVHLIPVSPTSKSR